MENIITIQKEFGETKKNFEYTLLKELKSIVPKLFTEENIQKLCKLAEDFFTLGNFERARIYFLFLSCFKPSDSYIWLMKGLTEQEVKQYDEALQSYYFAAAIDPTALMPYLQISECLILANQKQEAGRVLETILEQVREQEIDNPVCLAKIQAIRSSLQTNDLIK